MLTNNVVSFEQPGPDFLLKKYEIRFIVVVVVVVLLFYVHGKQLRSCRDGQLT